MKSETILGLAVVGVVALTGYLIYRHYQTIAPPNSVTLGPSGLAGTLNLNPLITGLSNDLSGFFGNLLGSGQPTVDESGVPISNYA